MKGFVENKITTVIGLLIIAAVLYSYITGRTTWPEASAGLLMGTGFLFSKDGTKPENRV